MNLRPAFHEEFYEGYDRDWSIAQAHPYSAALASDYARVLPALQEDDALLVHHTLHWPHMLALAAALSQYPASGARHAVFVMFNPGIDSRGQPTSARRHRGYRMALRALARDARVKLFASCSEYAESCRRALGAAAPLEVHPCFFFDTRGATLPAAAAFPGERVLLYAGDAKIEKGFCELPSLAAAFLGRARGRVVVQFHLSAAADAGPAHDAAVALRALAARESRLELIDGFIAHEKLAALLRGVSSAVFNYQPDAYADQTSGLLWQACSAGLPLAVVGENWLAREASRINPCVLRFASARALESALARSRSLRFRSAPIDAGYRARLFRPIGEFVRELRG